MNAKIVIELSPDGGLHVEGPIQDKILCLGLLSLAKHLILNMSQEENERRVIPAHDLPPPVTLPFPSRT